MKLRIFYLAVLVFDWICFMFYPDKPRILANMIFMGIALLYNEIRESK